MDGSIGTPNANRDAARTVCGANGGILSGETSHRWDETRLTRI